MDIILLFDSFSNEVILCLCIILLHFIIISDSIGCKLELMRPHSATIVAQNINKSNGVNQELYFVPISGLGSGPIFKADSMTKNTKT